MTEDLPAVWEPSKFDGSDLLPVAASGAKSSKGRENIKAEDIVLPSLKLLAGMSDEVTKQTVEGAVPGKFLHTGAQQLFSSPVRAIVCAHTRSRAMFPDPKNSRYDGLEKCLSRDAVEGSEYGDCDACPHKEWGKDDTTGKSLKPLCGESHNFTVLTNIGPAVVRMASRAIKSAKNFLTTWNFSSKDLWAHPMVFTTKAVEDTLPDGRKATNYVLGMRWDQADAVPPPVQQAAEGIYNIVSNAHEQGNFSSDEQELDKSEIPF
tara:strand:- start:10556 stop:11344 length:789 start_codon:yes stop_codon:yes gene_type:complete